MSDLENDVNKLFDRLEKHLEDFDFQHYIGPLIGDPEKLTEEEVNNLKKVLKYYEEHNVYLPLPNDPRYINIANYKDYEFTYCIAFEMAIRTDEFYKIKYLNMAIEDIQSTITPFLDCMGNYEKSEMIKNLNFSFKYFDKDIQTILFTDIQSDDLEKDLSKTLTRMLENLYAEKSRSKQIMRDLGILNLPAFLTQNMIVVDTDHEFKLLFQDINNLTINDIDNGLHMLIQYYYTKEKIYKKPIDNFKFEQLVIDKDKSINTDDILKDLEYYYVSIKQNLIRLSNNIPIIILDEDLKEMLKKHYKKYLYSTVQPNYTRPQLHFTNSNIINLPVNLNFKEDELIAFVRKIKKDYDAKNSIIQTPMELLGEKLEKAIAPKSLVKMPKGDKKNEAFAIAFCVYDLYKVLTPIFKYLDREFKKEKRRNTHYNKDDIDSRSPYNKLDLQNEIADIIGISSDKVQFYHTLMTEYIKDKKYIELITGHKQNTFD